MDCLESVSTLYIKGVTNSGKTTRVLDYVRDNDYEYRYTSLQQIKNEGAFKDLMTNKNIFNILQRKIRTRVLIIDNIDYLQNSDKNLIGGIIKCMKKDKRKNASQINKFSKVIFRGTNDYDKKILELFGLMDKILTFDKQLSIIEENKSIKQTVNCLLTCPTFDSTRISEKTTVSLVYHENLINHF